MKSDTKPDLKKPPQRDSLATGFERLPELLKEHSNKILLAVALVLLAFAALRYRNNQAKVDRYNTDQQLAVAWDAVNRLEALPTDGRLPAEVVALNRTQLFNSANDMLDGVIGASDSIPARTADAWLARGRLFWTMANLPPLAGASTRPALNPPKSSADYLASSEKVFDTVVKDFPQRVGAVTQARFALGAIYENKGDWDKAAEVYKLIGTTETALPADKRLAEERIARLEIIRKPVILATITPPVPDFLKPAATQPFKLDPTLSGSLTPDQMTTTAPTNAPASAPTTKP